MKIMHFISSKSLRPLLESILNSIVELHIGHRLVDDFLILTPDETSARDLRQLLLHHPQLEGVLTGQSILPLRKWIEKSSQEIDYKAKIAPSYIQEALLKSILNQDLLLSYPELSYKSILVLIQSFREELLNPASLRNFLEGFDPVLAQHCFDWLQSYSQQISQNIHLKDFYWQVESTLEQVAKKTLKTLKPIRHIYYLGFVDFPPLLKQWAQHIEKYYPEISQLLLCQIPDNLDPQDYLSKTWEESLQNLNYFEDKNQKDSSIVSTQYSSPFEEASAILSAISEKIQQGVNPSLIALTLPLDKFWEHYYQQQLSGLGVLPKLPSEKTLSQFSILENLFTLSSEKAHEQTDQLLLQKRKILQESQGLHSPEIAEELKALEAFKEIIEEVLFYEEEYPHLKPHIPSLKHMAQTHWLFSTKAEHAGVQIRSIEQLGLKQFQFNFIPQLNEDHFPKNPDRFFGLNLPNHSKQASHQQALYQHLLSSAQEVKLSYSKIGIQTQEQTPSSLILNSFQTPEKPPALVWGHAPLPSRFSEQLATEIKRQEDLSYQHAHGGWIQEKSILNKLQSWASQYSFSASRLEKYAACPFSFFASTLLKLDSEEEKTLQGDAREQGKWVHGLLENFFKQNIELLKKAGETPQLRKEVEEKIQTEIKLSAEDFLKNKPWVHPKLFGDFTQRTYQTCRDIFNHFWKQWESKRSNFFIPRFFEHSFGNESALVFTRPKLPPLRLKGQIDRIDVSEDGKQFITWDYKTGEIQGLTRDIKEFKKLQLPLYLLAAQRIAELKMASPLASLALGLKEMSYNQGIAQKEKAAALNFKGKPGCLLDENSWDNFWPEFEEKILDYFENIYRGDLRTTPEPCSEFCEYRTICRYHDRKTS